MQAPKETTNVHAARAVVELVTGDPMGAIRHVVACLARRAYPLLGMVCLPETDGTGRLVVAVADDGRLDRLMAELSGLPEVVGARVGDLRSGKLAAFLGEAVVV
jgi:acetolactate synthase I/III small subunit